MGLFYAWDGTLRHDDGVVRVNLLLNRASPWLDVDSYLPYEGKVVLHAKRARTAFVRIPLWVDRRSVDCRVGDRSDAPRWFGNYLRFDGLSDGDQITVEFPIVERVESYTVPGKIGGRPDSPGWPGRVTHSCRFKGNTLVELSQAIVPGSPLYQRRPALYLGEAAPRTTVDRYTTPLSLRW